MDRGQTEDDFDAVVVVSGIPGGGTDRNVGSTHKRVRRGVRLRPGPRRVLRDQEDETRKRDDDQDEKDAGQNSSLSKSIAWIRCACPLPPGTSAVRVSNERIESPPNHRRKPEKEGLSDSDSEWNSKSAIPYTDHILPGG